MLVIQLVSYAAVAIAMIALIAKAVRYATAPEHFRWELYPVPHEKGRFQYGGSFVEELDWWTRPRHPDRLNELKEMMQEIFFLKGVFHHNKRVWRFSFPFHFGLYLCTGWLGLLVLGSILQMSGVNVSAKAGAAGAFTHYLTASVGYTGLILTALGALGLFIWRLSEEQRIYNSFAEYFNLVLFDVVAVITLIAAMTSDPGFSYSRDYMQSLVTFSSYRAPSPLFAVAVVMVSLLGMYIPLTRMAHFVAKFFLYHDVRWNDQPNARGSKIEKHIIELLGQKVTWSAPHVRGDRTWKEVARDTSNE